MWFSRPRCGYGRPAYNSCRNRHCPKCQSLAQTRWIEQRLARTLETHYFHVVFTLPSELRSMAFVNRRTLFAMIFAAASQTLLALGGDPARLGATLGITALLHTWTSDLQFHPHLHCIVTGRGLALDGARWISARGTYLFSVKLLSRLFRGTLLAACTHGSRSSRYISAWPGTGWPDSLCDCGASMRCISLSPHTRAQNPSPRIVSLLRRHDRSMSPRSCSSRRSSYAIAPSRRPPVRPTNAGYHAPICRPSWRGSCWQAQNRGTPAPGARTHSAF